MCVFIMQVLSEGQAIGGFLSKINTSTPENTTQTSNRTYDDDDTHPMSDTTFAEDMHTCLPVSHLPGGLLGASHDPGLISHDPGQLGVASPGEVYKPFVDLSVSQYGCDSMTSSSEGEVRLERNGIDVIKVSGRSRVSSRTLKQKGEVVRSDQHITVSETDPLLASPAPLQDHGSTARDDTDPYPAVIMVSAAKRTQ